MSEDPRHDGTHLDEYDLSQLRAHVRAMHPKMRLARSNASLSHLHAADHHRRYGSHWHGPNANLGPHSRPAGWYTGQDVHLREPSVFLRSAQPKTSS